MEKASKTMNGKLSTALDALKTALGKLTQKLLPIVTKVVEKITDWANAFADLDDSTQETILYITGAVAAIGPFLTIIGKMSTGIGSVIKVLGTFKTAMEVAKGVTTSTSTAVNGLSKVFSAITSPIGLAVTAITASIGLIAIAVQSMNKDTKEAFSNMGKSANDFITGIGSAKSHLEEFNSTLFATAEEQQKLQYDMKEIQDGITLICKTASEERRDYTQEEIEQLDEYFEKLRNLKDQELEIQQSISSAIAQQAEQNAQSFNGSLEEFKITAQEWINTAQQQADAEIALINERTTQEIALLQQRYGEKATLENEEYAREYYKAMEQKEKLVAQANEQVAKVNSAYAQGYLERSEQESGWYITLKEYTDKQETLQENHNKKIQQIKDGELWYVTNTAQSIQTENETFAFNQKDIWDQMYENMDDNQEKQLGVWLAMVAQTELYGGEIDDETKQIVDNIIASYDTMPKETQEAMKNAMEPMLTEMEDKEPVLFAKAFNIADGVLSRLKKAFDINSPSKKTKKIFEYVMEGAEVGLSNKQKVLYKDIDKIAKEVLRRFNGKNLYNKMQSAVDMETQKLSANLTSNQVLKTQVEDNRQARLERIDNNKEDIVNTTTKLDSKVIARETNKVNARQKLQYGYA